MSRPLVSVYDSSSAASVSQALLPAVMTAPIRPDVVHYVHSLMSKNRRQAYAVAKEAGHQTPAISWGTGRAVARIPRVPGGGTSRSGQGAFGNMCRGGRMFAPTKIWRRWHKKISVNQRRYAVASALAASAIPALVMARGHKIDNTPEFPLVMDNCSVTQTKEAKSILEKLGAYDDVVKCKDSKKLRRGVGKMRNRRYTMRRGPLVVFDKPEGCERAFRNLPGVEVTTVDNLSLLDLAPGGHLGRFCVWSKGAFEKLDTIFGTYETAGVSKKGYHLPHSMMNNADLARIINSDEIQSIVRPAVKATKVLPPHRNPLKRRDVMDGLNPYAATARAAAVKKAAQNKDNHKKVVEAKRAERKVRKAFKGRQKEFFAAASAEGDIKF